MTFPLRAGLLPLVALLASGALAAEALKPEKPAPGRYAGQFCVTAAADKPSCGAAEIDLQKYGALRVRINDIVYQLQLHSSQVDVVLLHGTMQIDEFTANYAWAGRALQFADIDRQARYELRLESKRASD